MRKRHLATSSTSISIDRSSSSFSFSSSSSSSPLLSTLTFTSSPSSSPSPSSSRARARAFLLSVTLLLCSAVGVANAFVHVPATTRQLQSISQSQSHHDTMTLIRRQRQRQKPLHQRRHSSSSQLQLQLGFFQSLVSTVTVNPDVSSTLANYQPAATSLFNNMKLPAAVVTAGMISLGFATSFPELPVDTPERTYSQQLRKRCESLKRLHIVVALISVTSELIVVMWAAVEVNQLTERVLPPTSSVWALIQRDCDLAWSAVNSHFVLGIIGFVSMLAIRAYVMLLAAEASSALMSAAMTGTAAALCLMISVVNRGVEAGGGAGIGYGSTILDLFQHYVILLSQCATDVNSPGPLEASAIVLEIASIGFALKVLATGDDKANMFFFNNNNNNINDETIEDNNNNNNNSNEPKLLRATTPAINQEISSSNKNGSSRSTAAAASSASMPIQTKTTPSDTTAPVTLEFSLDSNGSINKGLDRHQRQSQSHIPSHQYDHHHHHDPIYIPPTQTLQNDNILTQLDLGNSNSNSNELTNNNNNNNNNIPAALDSKPNGGAE